MKLSDQANVFDVREQLCELLSNIITGIAILGVLLARIGTDNHVPGLPTTPSFMNGLIPFRDGFYVRTVESVIRRPLVFGVVVLLALAGSVFLASQLRVIVFPDSEEPYFTVTLEAANALGVSREAVDQVLVLLTNGLEVDDYRHRRAAVVYRLNTAGCAAAVCPSGAGRFYDQRSKRMTSATGLRVTGPNLPFG